MECNYISAIIGVAGTLLGTILGWLLAKLDFGKIHIVIDNFKTYTDYVQLKSKNIAKIVAPEINFTIKLFNSSSKKKVLRDFYIICFDKNKKQVYKDVPKDANTKPATRDFGDAKYLDVINLDGNSGMDIWVTCRIQLVEDFIKTKRIYLYYKTGKMKQKRKLIVKRDFSYIELQKEIENGKTENALGE